jgi:hypothetical protein
MSVLGGVLLYLASLTMLLAAAAIAAGAFLLDPQGGPAASAVTAQAASPPMLRKNDGKSGQKAKEGVQDVAKLHPVAPSASSISVKPKAERSQIVRPKRAASAKRTIRARPVQPPPSHYGAYDAYGYAAPPQPPRYFPYRR